MMGSQPKRSDTLAGQEGTKGIKGAEDPRAPRSEPPPRPACPRCGSAHTQPFTHAGPGARVNMKCIDCGGLFRDPGRRV